MAWDAVGELSSLMGRFRRPSVGRNWELLNAVWTNFRRAKFSEGGLWMPSPSEPEKLIQGFVFLSDGTLGTSAFVKKRQACYSTATKVAAAEFRRLAQLGGDILTRIPQLESELRPFADGGGIGPEPDHERWWLAYLFREPASKMVSKDYMVEDDRAYRESHRRGKHLPPPSKTRLIYECDVKGLYRASEAACERLIALLARRKVAKVKSNWRFVPFSDVDVKFGSTSPATLRTENRKGVTRTDAAFELQSMSDDEDTDDERRKRASDMSQKWGKRRTIKWPTPIGIAPESEADLFNVIELVAVLADAPLIRGEVIRYGGDAKLIKKLRKKARESLPMADCIAIRDRRATRTTRSSAKSKKTSRAKTPAKTRLV